MSIHKEKCWFPRASEELKRWVAAWPNYCRQCDGWGGFHYYDEDTGYQDFDPCPSCLDKDRCPRCGGGVIAEVYWDAGHFANCDTCGFIEATTPGGPRLEEPCSCIEDAYYDNLLDEVPY